MRVIYRKNCKIKIKMILRKTFEEKNVNYIHNDVNWDKNGVNFEKIREIWEIFC